MPNIIESPPMRFMSFFCMYWPSPQKSSSGTTHDSSMLTIGDACSTISLENLAPDW